MTSDDARISAAEVVLASPDLDETIAFFTERLGFRIDLISPADDPSVAVVSGHGLRLRLEREGRGAPGELRLLCDDPALGVDGEMSLVAPNGTRIELVPVTPALVVPPVRGSFTVTRLGDVERWGVGRAGMRYRDLIPDRQGGRFIASHIRIPEGGLVPDYVHHHDVRFQMIYCSRGWVQVVYEDQGPPFVLQAGDSVLQPPGIRHRVLEASPGLEVIELACPAAHPTFADHELHLPTPNLAPDRMFGDQRFVRHQAASARWGPWRINGFECRDLGIAAATDGLAGARVARPLDDTAGGSGSHRGELSFLFVLDGEVTLDVGELDAVQLRAGDCATLPAGVPHRLSGCSPDLQVLEVSMPAG